MYGKKTMMKNGGPTKKKMMMGGASSAGVSGMNNKMKPADSQMASYKYGGGVKGLPGGPNC